uniref:Uncharacterized protein n=1 Tax=Anguilla anguilla TaxID=7936 RepID=A0A0E9Q7L4_ANGAN
MPSGRKQKIKLVLIYTSFIK